MIRKPTLTVLIPVFNFAVGLEKILQRFEFHEDEIEILIRDNSTNSDCEQVAKKFSKLNLRYIKNEPPTGPVENWNRLLKDASGEFIWLIHNDDYPTSKADVENILAQIRKPGIDCLLFNLDLVDGNGLKIRRHFSAKITSHLLAMEPRLILHRNFIGPTATLVIRRRFCTYFDVGLRWFVDLRWYFEIFRKKPKLVCCESVVIKSIQQTQISLTEALADEKKILRVSEKAHIWRDSKPLHWSLRVFENIAWTSFRVSQTAFSKFTKNC